MPRVYDTIKEYLVLPKIIHIVGTNGKGTTGRFLATALMNAGYKTAHYSSPHILKFNERIWFNGKDIDDESLENAHKQLLRMINLEDAESLSYFEYTTLLALWIFQDVEYAVLEAGLGGEYDATAVFKNILTIVTPIDKDHEAFLGNSIQEIATTKLNAMQKKVILAKQSYQDIYTIAHEIALKKGVNVYRVDELLNDSDRLHVEQIRDNLHLTSYLKENLSVSIAALNSLGISYKKEYFDNSRLFGRVSELDENIMVDVGHNPLAAKALRDALRDKKYILIYNTYKDKDYKEILSILKPIIEHVQILEIENQRIESYHFLEKSLMDLAIPFQRFKEIKAGKKYLVFGSFSVVEKFVHVYKESYE